MTEPRCLADIATRPAVSCRPAATLAEVAATMRDREVGCVVVVDADDRPVGICTDRDLVVRALADRWPEQSPVAAAMTDGVFSLGADTPIADAAPVLERKGIRRVAVLDDAGRVIGVASLDDIVRELVHEIEHVAGALTPSPRPRP